MLDFGWVCVVNLAELRMEAGLLNLVFHETNFKNLSSLFDKP